MVVVAVVVVALWSLALVSPPSSMHSYPPLLVRKRTWRRGWLRWKKGLLRYLRYPGCLLVVSRVHRK